MDFRPSQHTETLLDIVSDGDEVEPIAVGGLGSGPSSLLVAGLGFGVSNRTSQI
jgi:hypothetical protein